MKVTFITTIKHNVGDDFVREGLKFLFSKFYKKKLRFSSIHKHSPLTARTGFSIIRDWKKADRLDKKLPLVKIVDKILTADLVVQSGAPVYWCHDDTHCAINEWYTPLIRRRFSRNKKARLLNLAAGTCQKFNSDGNEFKQCEICSSYIKEFYETAALTTVRDKLAQDVLSSLGINVPLIPCSSIFAIDQHRLKSSAGEFVAVNYMEIGGHYSFGQNIDAEKWKTEFNEFYKEASQRERIVFICHNQKEIEDAKRIDPSANIFFSKNFLDYMKVYSKAKFGIMNRVHGAFMMASFGKPSLIIGADSRARMGAEIGLDSVFINDADAKLLLDRFNHFLSDTDTFSERFHTIKEKAYTDYMNALGMLPKLL